LGLDALDTNGNTLLYYVVKRITQNKSIIQALLNQGANPNMQFKSGLIVIGNA
jgi:hypothetical protein